MEPVVPSVPTPNQLVNPYKDWARSTFYQGPKFSFFKEALSEPIV